jgi:hypothetical protein
MGPGYLHREYAASFADVGTSLPLPLCGGWLIRRPIAGSPLYDAMGCYPLFCCRDWSLVADDLATLGDRLVSVVIVADPCGAYTPAALGAAFDRIVPYKEHYVVEAGRPAAAFVSASHQAAVRRARRHVEVEQCARPADFLDDWERLFAVLAARHAIVGLRRFSRAAFERQFAVPGLVMSRAVSAGATVGLDVWYEQDGCAYAHLAACDAAGYRLRASYATKWAALDYFRDRVRWINLGGVADQSDDGLGKFKKGWSTTTRTAWLCAKVLNPAAYNALTRESGTTSQYFPAYRARPPHR